MAGEIQLNSTTMATESSGTITLSNVDSATNRQNLGLEIGVDVQAFDADTTKNDVANTFTANQIISVTDNTNAALRVTQLGTGNALVVEDSTNPDSSPFVVDASGNVEVGATLTVNGGYSGAGNIITSSGIIRSPDGSASVPSIQPGVDADTGFYRPASNTIGFVTGGTERMQIDSSGNVILSTGFIRLPDGSASVPSIQPGVDADTGFYRPAANNIGFSTGGTQRMLIDGSGNIGAPSGTNIYNASDERLKQNITELSGCLQKVLLMRGVSFNWIDEFCDTEADKTLYGLIAQELQIVDSNLVDSFSDSTITAGSVTVENPLRVNEKFIIPMLVESIKEQQALIESQQSQIDALTARIEALEATP